MKLSEIKINPKNPRIIKDDRFKKLVKSVEEFPKMMKLRPIVIDEQGMVLGGNMRLKVLQHLKFKEIPDEWVKRADELTEDEKQRFIVSDNVGFGDWDWDALANEWDAVKLEEWGLEIPEKIDKLNEGEEIEFERSVQLKPPMEYIMIICEPNSEEWEDLKEKLKLKLVKRGGYRVGSPFDDHGLERVLTWNNFKDRYVNSNTE